MSDKGQQYLFTQDVVQPAHVEQYEQTMKELHGEMLKHGFEVPIEIMQFTNQVYYVMSPVDTLDAIDSLSNSFVALADQMGLEKYLSKLQRSFASMYYQNHAVVYQHRALSFWPEGQRPAFGELSYVHWQVFYVQPDKNQEALETYAQIDRLRKAQDAPCNYDFYTLTIGQEMPAFMVVHHALDAAEFHRCTQQSEMLLGKKGEKLHKALAATLRRTEELSGCQRPDLSYLK